MTNQDKINHLINLMDEAIHIWYNSPKRTEYFLLVKNKSGFFGKNYAYTYLRFANSTTLEKKHINSLGTERIFTYDFRNPQIYLKMLKETILYLEHDDIDTCIKHYEELLNK